MASPPPPYPLPDTTVIASQNGVEIGRYVSDEDSYYEIMVPVQGPTVYDVSVSHPNYTTYYQNTEVPPEGINKNFTLQPGIGGQSSKLPAGNSSMDENTLFTSIQLGEWNYEHSTLIANAVEVNIHEFDTPRLYYLYQYNSQLSSDSMMERSAANTVPQPMYSGFDVDGNNFVLSQVPLNYLFNTGSSFPTFNTFNMQAQTLNAVSSKLASQPVHTSSGIEIKAGDWSSWLTIPIQSLPAGTKFLRIAIAGYHNEEEKDKSFNLYPTSNSKHFDEFSVESSNLDYQTDPMVLTYPWLQWQNDSLWLSNYGYMLKPLTRSQSSIILAMKGPCYGGYSNNSGSQSSQYKSSGFRTGGPGHGEEWGGDPLPQGGENYQYENFWYGPVFLDWDKLLGNEGILWLLGWTSAAFGFDSWKYTQLGDTYHPEPPQFHDNAWWKKTSHKAAPSHYWLKNFGMLSYWCMFNYTSYFPPIDVPKRIQLPINLLTEPEGDLFEIWERPICTPKPYESSSLSIGLLTNPRYPEWLPSLAPIFGQSKIFCSPDLYSSYFYVMQRINHIMLDTSLWLTITTNYDQANGVWYGRNSPSNGNLDKWRVEIAGVPDGTGVPYPRQTWWSWYTSIPWAKGVAFPIPGTLNPREGWEAPQVEPYPPYSDTNYSTLQNQPNTIFMSTAHYPLGSIQVAVKKKK